jgi:hypothetical protein
MKSVLRKVSTRRFGRFTAIAATLLAGALGVITVRAAAAQEGARSPFVGAWRVVEMLTVRPDGTTIPDELVGQHPVGLLIYTPHGEMSAQIMRTDRPLTSDERRAKKPLDPGAANSLLNGYLAYFGSFEVDEKNHAIRHHLLGTLHPASVGATFVRHYDLQGDRLILSTPPFVEAGEQRHDRITFERVRTQKR